MKGLSCSTVVVRVAGGAGDWIGRRAEGQPLRDLQDESWGACRGFTSRWRESSVSKAIRVGNGDFSDPRFTCLLTVRGRFTSCVREGNTHFLQCRFILLLTVPWSSSLFNVKSIGWIFNPPLFHPFTLTGHASWPAFTVGEAGKVADGAGDGGHQF